MNTRDLILEKFYSGEAERKSASELFELFHIKKGEQKAFFRIIDSLKDENLIYKDKSGKFMCVKNAADIGLIKGKISGNERGFGFLIPDDRETFPKDFFLPKKNMNGAMHGDAVLCRKVSSSPDSDEAEVVSILERGYKVICGILERDKIAGLIVHPDERKYFKDIKVVGASHSPAKVGQKVTIRIIDYPEGKMPVGEIEAVLGDGDDFFVEEDSIIFTHDLRTEFDEKTLKEADKCEKQKVSPIGRLDLRDKLILTIDNDDTRDIDDAVSLDEDEDGYILGVHIADVSHYVLPKSALDNEAYERGTSVYFPDRVLPMLPKQLSNGICSLNEGEDRLALSAIMSLDRSGKVVSTKIERTIINSRHKMTYSQVSAILDGDRELSQKYEDIVPTLFKMRKVAEILNERRQSKGCINLDVKETKILMDEEYNITIPDYERSISHKIIEEFMLTANESVATFISALDLPFLYRVHEKPSDAKANDFLSFLRDLGVHAKLTIGEIQPYEYSNILKSVEDRPFYSVVNKVMLRSMQKARYSHENTGHFGLASDCYCHFTSPIRRYPDLLIHRIIKCVLDGDVDEIMTHYSSFVAEAAKHCSETERKADECERDVDELYKVQYMSYRIGEEYDAVISGVMSFGVFAELANTIEGFIPFETLPDDEYIYEEDKLVLKGRKHSFRIGESIRVRVDDVDYSSRRTHFGYIAKIKNE